MPSSTPPPLPQSHFPFHFLCPPPSSFDLCHCSQSTVYQKTVPASIFSMLMELTSLDIAAEQSGSPHTTGDKPAAVGAPAAATETETETSSVPAPVSTEDSGEFVNASDAGTANGGEWEDVEGSESKNEAAEENEEEVEVEVEVDVEVQVEAEPQSAEARVEEGVREAELEAAIALEAATELVEAAVAEVAEE